MKLEEPPVVGTEAGDLIHRRLLTARERQGVVLCANSLLLLRDAGGWGGIPKKAARVDEEGNWKDDTAGGERYCRDSDLAMIAELDNGGAGRCEAVETQDGRGARVASWCCCSQWIWIHELRESLRRDQPKTRS